LEVRLGFGWTDSEAVSEQPLSDQAGNYRAGES
jgi:hypothetical protein